MSRTIYQAASVAHGHLLHFKQEWRPDGYSIGDLIYSLPLAPGQKKQTRGSRLGAPRERRQLAVARLRREPQQHARPRPRHQRGDHGHAQREHQGELEGDDRWHGASATGGALMGVFQGGTFGALHGISGGKSSSGSTASQNSHRDSTANSLQSISDRTTQAASSVRSQRATVIQTVSQGERCRSDCRVGRELQPLPRDHHPVLRGACATSASHCDWPTFRNVCSCRCKLPPSISTSACVGGTRSKST